MMIKNVILVVNVRRAAADAAAAFSDPECIRR